MSVLLTMNKLTAELLASVDAAPAHGEMSNVSPRAPDVTMIYIWLMLGSHYAPA